MKTTLNLNAELVRRATKAAAERGTTLAAMIEDALREKLARHAVPPRQRRVLRTFKGDGLQPGVELSSSAALLERLDDDADP